ncbi:MAG: hypothetical protein A2X12_06435 [Bacteroidetes bacterium GWE2_29_8]|nr:MAG: hypothetical protein A2X12_06435 [Bacteroidetes bacterium GWE2_29_8]
MKKTLTIIMLIILIGTQISIAEEVKKDTTNMKKPNLFAFGVNYSSHNDDMGIGFHFIAFSNNTISLRLNASTILKYYRMPLVINNVQSNELFLTNYYATDVDMLVDFVRLINFVEKKTIIKETKIAPYYFLGGTFVFPNKNFTSNKDCYAIKNGLGLKFYVSDILAGFIELGFAESINNYNSFYYYKKPKVVNSFIADKTINKEHFFIGTYAKIGFQYSF